MPVQNNILWEIEPHTKAKHEILKRYLDAWLPILSHAGFPKILYIDGFAGPGKYSGGEDGSPIIALKAASKRTIPIRSNVHFEFIEKEGKNADYLKALVDTYQFPKNVAPSVRTGEFAEIFPEIFKQYNQSLPPTFAFIDPFGWTGVPFQLICQITAVQNNPELA